MKQFMIVMLVAALVLTACAQQGPPVQNGNQTNNTGDSALAEGQCGNSRPDVCTKEYYPVCGDNGKTYGNKCEACSDTNVSNYTTGACASSKLFEVTYAGGFVAPAYAQTIFSVTGHVFSAETRSAENTTTALKQRNITDDELRELQDILAHIGNLRAEYTSDAHVTDVGYADIVVGNEHTRINPNIDESYPAELRALREWISNQTEQLPDEQGRIYKSRDPSVCMRIKFACEEGQQYFGDESGCGCEPAKEQVSDFVECNHTAARGMMCAQVYNPVCAQVDTGIRCIKAPCPSLVYKTYSNSCEACKDEKVYGYNAGECGNLEGKNPA